MPAVSCAATGEHDAAAPGWYQRENGGFWKAWLAPGGLTLPRLSWRRRAAAADACHLALAFDIFTTKIEIAPVDSIAPASLEMHGIALTPERTFKTTPMPRSECVRVRAPRARSILVVEFFPSALLKRTASSSVSVAKSQGGSNANWRWLQRFRRGFAPNCLRVCTACATGW